MSELTDKLRRYTQTMPEQQARDLMNESADTIEQLQADNRRLREAAKKLSFAAQTTGGTAGRDEILQEGIGVVEQALAQTDAPTEAEIRASERRDCADTIEIMEDGMAAHVYANELRQ